MREEWVRLNVAPKYHINREGVIRDEFDEIVPSWTGDHGEPLVSLMTRQQSDFTFDVTYLLEETFANGVYDDEEWVTIAEAPAYDVSSLGRVRHHNLHRLVRPAILGGRWRVRLTINPRKQRVFWVDDLVKAAF